jgi:hypothetical protein
MTEDLKCDLFAAGFSQWSCPGAGGKGSPDSRHRTRFGQAGKLEKAARGRGGVGSGD